MQLCHVQHHKCLWSLPESHNYQVITPAESHLPVLIFTCQLERMGLQLLDCLSRSVCCHALSSSHGVYHLNSFPPGIPDGTAVPQWAFQDVTVGIISSNIC